MGLWLALFGLGGCNPPAPARFAGWAPVRGDIAPPSTRAQALKRLRESYGLWQKWRRSPPSSWLETGRPANVDASFGYTYVSAQQESSNDVRFTLFEVQAERVVLRALLTADPDELSSLPRRAGEPRALVSRWVERSAPLGTHLEGAPLKTIEELYADCERLVRRAGSALPRLYFHPDGLLLQCGYPPSECADCPSSAMLSISRFSVASELPRDDAAAWLCETETGPVPPGSRYPFLPPDYACFAAISPAGRRSTKEASQAVRVDDCEQDSPLCPERPEPEPVRDICSIDPAACPPPPAGYGVAHWTQVRPSPCPSWPQHAPRPLEVGKTQPLSEWTFPFSSSAGVECSGGTGLLRIRPEL